MKQSEVRRFFKYVWAAFLFSTSAVLLAANTGPATFGAPAPELLEAEQAFQSSARVKDGKMLEVAFKVADSYYLYRKRFQITPTGNTLKLGKAQIPPGKMKQDATFGRVEIYRKSVRMLVPYSSSDKEFHFQLVSQGCADAGVCYPPLKQAFVVKAGDTMAVAALDVSGARGSVVRAAPGSIADLIKKAP